MKLFTIVYLQYGKWYCTMPFIDESEAKNHTARYFLSNEIRNQKTGEILANDDRAHITDVHLIAFDPMEGKKLK